ncbi:MAG: hypothetical protein PHH49_03895 [Candidatus Omnitrophica bacterium]|nr:hypothetical protein [Candidatus Omnitrophota bacterium]MDD5488091.1 hypothetical protein [Candidatus Omnitrophota bacterium]
MYRIMLFLSLAGVLFLSGCATVDGEKPIEIYTFQKDRVDQKISGNQGYLQGTAPATTAPRNTKRTLIGVDVALPMEGSEEPAESAPVAEKEVYVEEKTTVTTSGDAVTVTKTTTTQTEDLDETEFLEAEYVK